MQETLIAGADGRIYRVKSEEDGGPVIVASDPKPDPKPHPEPKPSPPKPEPKPSAPEPAQPLPGFEASALRPSHLRER